MTVYRRRRAHIVPGVTDRKPPEARSICRTAAVEIGNRRVEVKLLVPVNYRRDPRLAVAVDNRLRIMLANRLGVTFSDSPAT